MRRSRTARATAQLLAILLLVPYLLGGLSIRPASAQAEGIDIIVMDFNNRSGFGGALLGRSAAAALALEVAQSDRWTVVPERTVQEALNRLNLRPPFDRIALTRLAQQVDARQVVVGEVVSVKLHENPAQATVTVAVQVMDRASQEMVNGGVATGRSAPRIGYTGDPSLLVDEALSNASFQIRQQAERYQLVEGTVLNTAVVGESYEALMNIGARQGVKQGMHFIILRAGELVAKGRARAVDPDFTTVGVTENFRGVKPEDRVRAVFQIPPIPKETSAAPGPRVVVLQQPAEGQSQPGDVITPEVTPPARERKPSMTKGARMLAGGLLLLGLFGLASRHGGTRAFRTEAQPTVQGTEPSIRVTWERPREVSSEDVIQYQVIRSTPAQGECAVGVVVGDRRQFVDGTSATAAQRNLANLVTGSTGTGGGQTGGGGTAGRAIPACADADLPIVLGRTYQYSIQVVHVIPVDLDGGGGGGGGMGGGGTTTGPTQAVSVASTASGPVTAIGMPTLTAPADGATGVTLAGVTFQFTSTQGATTYVVQVATNASFTSGASIVASVPNADRQGGEALSTGPVNLQAQFAGRSPLFWRVGARNDTDETQPDGGYVFSLARSFIPAATP